MREGAAARVNSKALVARQQASRQSVVGKTRARGQNIKTRYRQDKCCLGADLAQLYVPTAAVRPTPDDPLPVVYTPAIAPQHRHRDQLMEPQRTHASTPCTHRAARAWLRA